MNLPEISLTSLPVTDKYDIDPEKNQLVNQKNTERFK